MSDSFNESLLIFQQSSVIISAANPDVCPASIAIEFSQGGSLRADFWRLIKDGERLVSSFDHQQQYGLPAPINAIKELQKELQNKAVVSSHLDKATGDLCINFSGNIVLQVFNFTGYEVWELSFPNSAVEYSNYN